MKFAIGPYELFIDEFGKLVIKRYSINISITLMK